MKTGKIVSAKASHNRHIFPVADHAESAPQVRCFEGITRSVPGAMGDVRSANSTARSFVAAGASPRVSAASSFLATPTLRNLRTLLCISGLFAWALMTAGCQTPTHAEAKIQAEQRWSAVRGQVKLQLARQQYAKGHFEDALKTLDEAIALDPQSPEAYALLAKCNLELGKPTKAGQVIAVAFKKNCVSADLHYLQGVVLEQRDDLAGAIVEFEKACELDPHQATYLLARVEILVALDRRTEALALVDKHAHEFDDNAALTLLGARIAMMQGDLDGALERFQDPAVRNADSQMATEELGALLARKGHHREAIRLLADRCQPDQSCNLSALGQRTLAESHLVAGEGEDALRVLSLTPISESNDAGIKRLTAKAAIAARQYMQALAAIEAARVGNPADAELEILMATANWKRGDLAGAEEGLHRVVKANPADVEAWCLLGEVLYDAGRSAEALGAMERGLELDPNSRWASVRIRDMRAGTGPKR